jgi:hypothetical protein
MSTKSVSVAIAVFVLAASQLLLHAPPSVAQGTPQPGAFTFELLVRRGDPVHQGGAFFNCKDCEGYLAGAQSINNYDGVLVRGDHTGGCLNGRYIAYDRRGERVVDSCEATAFGRLEDFGGAVLNDYDQVAFQGAMKVDGSLIWATYLYSDGLISKIAAVGDPSPIGPIAAVGPTSINSHGDVALFIRSALSSSSGDGNGVFVFSGGAIRKVVASGDPSPIGGTFRGLVPARIQENGDVLFWGQVETTPIWREGLFVATQQGIEKVVATGDPIPGVEATVDAPTNLSMRGDMNFSGEVAFVTMLEDGRVDSGIFLRTRNGISKIVAARDHTPIGGNFASFKPRRDWTSLPPVHLNANSAVGFGARVYDGGAKRGIFLASPTAMVKVVAIGDVLPNGDRLAGFSSSDLPDDIPGFAMNDESNLAFSAYKQNGVLVGIFLATPARPTIQSVRLKREDRTPKLLVTGGGFIANDGEIRINGKLLKELSYPDEFLESGGTTTRIVSRDPLLEELLVAGTPVEIEVHNRLTGKLSEPFTFTP